MILVVGNRADPHVTSVVEALEQRGAEFSVFDPFDKESNGLHHQIVPGAILHVGGKERSLHDYDAVWWRLKPRFTIPTASIDALYDFYFVHREWNYLMNYLAFETAGAFSINNRDKSAVADNKMTQLKWASECGFRIPPTLVSNNVEAILEFASSIPDRRCVFKTFTPYMPPSGLLTYTTPIQTSVLLENVDKIESAPGIFQAFIQKRFELRITVVGEEVFAARVNSQFSEHTEIDWRRDVFADLYSAYEIGAHLKHKLLSLHERFGLFYGAYDFIVDDSEDDPVFLEVNPSGQWMWLESKLGFPISDRIAGALTRAPHAASSDGAVTNA